MLKVVLLVGTVSISAMALAQSNPANQSATEVDQVQPTEKHGEVLDNPTLKTLSGSLSNWSMYSSFSYKGASISDPTSAERPNITDASEKPSLQALSGNLGVKYRIGKKNNVSVQVGTYMSTPFHSEFSSDDPRVQRDFDNNHQSLDFDDPRVSYFRTYYLGKFQNVSFVTIEKTTRGVLTDYGYFGNLQLSHATAYALSKQWYLAGTLGYAQYFFDKDTTVNPRYGTIDLAPFQTERVVKVAVATEYYLNRQVAVRLTTDVGTYFHMRDEDVSDYQSRDLQQTLAASYFLNRDISIAPNLQFDVTQLSSKRTNYGMTFNVNL